MNAFWMMVQLVAGFQTADNVQQCKVGGMLTGNKALSVWQGNIFSICLSVVFKYSPSVPWSLYSLTEWNNAEQVSTHMYCACTHTQSLNWIGTLLFNGSFIQLKCHREWAVGVAWLRGQDEGLEFSRVRWSSWLYGGTVVLNIGNGWVGGKAEERRKGQRPDEHHQPSFVLSHCFVRTYSPSPPSFSVFNTPCFFAHSLSWIRII